jgi:hypothetical protein
MYFEIQSSLTQERQETETKTLRNIRIWIVVFAVILALSGITAVPVEWELKLLLQINFLPTGLTQWLTTILHAIQDVNARYPFILYGNDWLAFGHIVIASAFIGAYRDPVRNKWIIDWAMLACVMVIPVAVAMGAYRGIPIYWRLIDCSFGVVGLLPLWQVRNLIHKLEKYQP